MESEEDLVERLIARLPIEEAEECLCRLEEHGVTVDVLRTADVQDLTDELGFTVRQCDAVLLDDVAWRAKHGRGTGQGAPGGQPNADVAVQEEPGSPDVTEDAANGAQPSSAGEGPGPADGTGPPPGVALQTEQEKNSCSEAKGLCSAPSADGDGEAAGEAVKADPGATAQAGASIAELLRAMAANDHGKMSMHHAVRQGQYGRIELFGRSLEERLGGMSDDAIRGLFAEHCVASDCDDVFTVPNHPELPPTTPKLEFAVVVGEDGVDTNTWTIKPMAEGGQPVCSAGAKVPGRELRPVAYYEACEQAQRAKLTRGEIVALRLFTGPMYERYNRVLRATLDEEQRGAEPRVALDVSNTYGTTIGLIISGIIKLSRFASARRGADGTVVAFKGLAGVALPPAFFARDAQGFCGVVEAAFLSLTDDEQVALDYARLGEGTEATIFELELAKDSLGAEIAWLSQWPQEHERLLPPWTHLEVISPPTRRKDGVTVVRVRPTVFQNVQTVEEVAGARKEEIRAHIGGLVRELRNQVNLSLVHKPDRTSDEYVQKKLKKYEFMFVQVAYRAESNKLTEMFPSMVQREDRDRDATATANIHRLVEHWVQNGKTPTRKNVAVALRMMLDGERESSVLRLKNQHPPWTRVEEACVKRVLELRRLDFRALHGKLGTVPLQELFLSEYHESDDEGGAELSATELDANLAAFEQDLRTRFCRYKAKWYHDNSKYKVAFLGVLREVESARPQIFDRYSDLSKRLAAMQQPQAGGTRILTNLVNASCYNGHTVTLIERTPAGDRWVVRLDDAPFQGKELTVKPANLSKVPMTSPIVTAAGGTPTFVVCEGWIVNVRDGPSLQAKILNNCSTGTLISTEGSITVDADGHKWIKREGRQEYMMCYHTEWGVVMKEVKNHPQKTAQFVVCEGWNVNVRDGPSSDTTLLPPVTGELELGAQVEIHSLERSPELNGMRGEIVEAQDPVTERWKVKMEHQDGRVVALKPGNLRCTSGNAVSNLHSRFFQDPSLFQDASKSFRATLGSDDEFAGGITGKLGQMDLEYVKRMYMEHNQEHDAQQQFTYGAKGRKSTAQHEWRFVVGSQGVNVITFAFDLERSEPEYTPQDMVEGRNAKPLRELMRLSRVKKAGLQVAEVVGLRLYSGPLFAVYNRVQRGLYKDGDTLYTTTAHVIKSGIFKLAMITAPPPDLTLYRGTGNMALGPDFFQRDEQGFAGGVELGFMSATASRQVALEFAGIEAPSPLGLKWQEVGSEKPALGHQVTNEALARRLEQQQLEFTKEEWGKFKVLALSDDSYIKAGNRYFRPAAEEGKEASKDLPTLYVIQVGKMSIGADIADISQFEDEKEFVYPMLTRLQLVKEPELSPNGKISQIHLKLTVNQRSTTVEDAEQARRRFLTRLAHSLQWDAKNWAYTHQGLLSHLGMQIAGAGQRSQEVVQGANLAVLNTIEGYGRVFERLMDGWEGEVLTIVKDLQAEGEAALSAGRTSDGLLRIEQAIHAAQKLCADTKEVRDRELELRRVLVKTRGATIDCKPAMRREEASSLCSLAMNLRQLGKYPEAMAMFEEARAIAAEADDKHGLFKAILGIGCIHEALEKGPEMVKACEEAESLAQELFQGHDHEELAWMYASLGNGYEMCQQHVKALEMNIKALEMFRRCGDDPENVGPLQLALGNTYLNMGNLRDALVYMLRALDIMTKAHGPEHEFVATPLNNLGNLYKELNRPEEAITHLERALKIRVKVFGPHHRDVGTTKNNLGGVLHTQNRHSEALAMLTQALEIRDQVFGEDHPMAAETRCNLGSVLQAMNKMQDAKKMYTEAAASFRSALGPDHPRTTMADLLVASVDQAANDAEWVKDNFRRVQSQFEALPQAVKEAEKEAMRRMSAAFDANDPDWERGGGGGGGGGR